MMAERKLTDERRRPDERRRAPRMQQEDGAENILEGRNALSEALASGRTVDKVFIAEGSTDRALARLAALAKQAGAVVVETDRRKLDQMSATGAHQGVIAQVAAHDYATIDDIFARAEESGRPPLIVLCDELSDPQRGPDGGGGQDLGGRAGVYARGARGESHRGDRRAEKPRRVGIRHSGGRRDGAVSGRPQKRGGHRHRKRGQRHEPPRRGAVRF